MPIPITYSLLATQCPAPSGPGPMLLMADASVSNGVMSNVIGTQPITTSPSGLIVSDNWNSKAIDFAAKMGSPGYCVLDGLALSAVGTVLTVGKGHACMDGPVELSADTNGTLVDGFTNFVYLKQGTGGAQPTIVVEQSLAVPAGNCLYIGNIPVAGGVATAYDYSNVIRWEGMPVRRTLDMNMPADAPGVNWCFIHQSQYGRYLWDGTKYIQLGAMKMATVGLSAIDTAGGVFSWQNPEGAAIAVVGIEIDAETPATAACSLDIGTTAVSGTTASDNLIDGLDVHTAAGLFGIQDQAGANGKFRQRVAAGKWVTASKDTGATAGLSGFAYIHYFVLN